VNGRHRSTGTSTRGRRHTALAEDLGPKARRDRSSDLGRSVQGSNAAFGPKDRPGAKLREQVGLGEPRLRPKTALVDNSRVTGTIVCGVCGTVNVGVFARCIACGQDLAGLGRRRDDDGAPPRRAKRDAPSRARDDDTGPTSGGKRPSSHAKEASEELDSASYRQTVVEMPKGGDTAPVRTERPAASEPRPHSGGAARGARFVARLLLPEGDRRSMEVGREGVVLGSGLDELGLSGDPRTGAGEAKLVLDDGRLFLDPAPGAQNVYRRIDREVKLEDGDVVLMGDVAAAFTHVDPGGAVDAARQVLGGSANAPCGRLVFLRRDGSAGPVHDLPAGKTVVGRTDGHLNFPNDSRLSRRHALFFASDRGVTVEDMQSRNGTYLRVRSRQELVADDALRIGSSGVQIRTK
jgi:hypothetical protein